MYDVCLSIGPLIPRVPSFVICSAKIIAVGCRGCVGLLVIVDVSEGEDRYPARNVNDVPELSLDVIELTPILRAEADPIRIPCVDVNDVPRNVCAVSVVLWIGEGAVDELCGAGCDGVDW